MISSVDGPLLSRLLRRVGLLGVVRVAAAVAVDVAGETLGLILRARNILSL